MALSVTAAVVDLVFPSLVPEPLRYGQEAVNMQEFRLRDDLIFGISLSIVIAVLVTAAGLCKFHPWAPRVALYVTVASFSFTPFLEAEVYSALAATLSAASATLWGVVLAMAFLPPLSERFRVLPTKSSTQPTNQRSAAD